MCHLSQMYQILIKIVLKIKNTHIYFIYVCFFGGTKGTDDTFRKVLFVPKIYMCVLWSIKGVSIDQGRPHWPLNGEKMININNVLRCFPMRMYKKIDDFFLGENININLLEEIRFRVNRPIILKIGDEEKKIDYIVSQEEILEILSHICDNSIYTYQSQICNGYITMQGGHRVGITGNAVMKDGKVSNINYVSSLNFRISKQVLGASNKVIKYVLNEDEKEIYSTLIVSPPGMRKNNNFKRFNKKN